MGDDSNITISGNPNTLTCGSYSFDAYSSLGNGINLTLNAQIGTEHFSVRLIFWLVLLENWSSAEWIKISLVGENQTEIINSTKMNVSQNVSCPSAFMNITSFFKVDL